MTNEMPSPASDREISQDEAWELVDQDRADEALKAAIKLGDEQLIAKASRIILCSGSYSDESKKLAANHNHDFDLKSIRKKILS